MAAASYSALPYPRYRHRVAVPGWHRAVASGEDGTDVEVEREVSLSDVKAGGEAEAVPT